MDGYLLDTSLLSAILDPLKPNHEVVRRAIGDLDERAPKYVSAISVGELKFGGQLAELTEHRDLGRFKRIIRQVEAYPLLPVTKHTAEMYGRLKARLADKYLAKALRREKRPRWVEEWVDRATGQKLQVDENDLWMCAQASERGLVLLTTDVKMRKIEVVNLDLLRMEFV